jgi:hypothetical protein
MSNAFCTNFIDLPSGWYRYPIFKNYTGKVKNRELRQDKKDARVVNNHLSLEVEKVIIFLWGLRGGIWILEHYLDTGNYWYLCLEKYLSLVLKAGMVYL